MGEITVLPPYFTQAMVDVLVREAVVARQAAIVAFLRAEAAGLLADIPRRVLYERARRIERGDHLSKSEGGR